MIYGYIGKTNSAKEFKKSIVLFEQKGILLDNVVMNIPFEEFVESLSDGDAVVVCSYVGLFPSLGSYLTAGVELIERGVVIESIQEPNLCINDSNNGFIRELNALNRQLRSASSVKSINTLKNGGKRVGRPRGSTLEQQKKVAMVEKLLAESKISVIKACKLTDCKAKTYYRLRNKEGAGMKPNVIGAK